VCAKAERAKAVIWALCKKGKATVSQRQEQAAGRGSAPEGGHGCWLPGRGDSAARGSAARRAAVLGVGPSRNYRDAHVPHANGAATKRAARPPPQ